MKSVRTIERKQHFRLTYQHQVSADCKMEEAELTSKQIRRARNRAALKERKEAAGDSVIPKAEKRESKEPVQPKVEKSAVTAVRIPSVPKTKVKIKKLREQSDSDDGDLIAEVETPLDLDSVMDADFMAEIAALARECAANNPFDLEESESEDSVEEEVKPSKQSAITSEVLSTIEKTSQLSTNKAVKIKMNEAASSTAAVHIAKSSKQSGKEDQVLTNTGKASEKDKNSSWNFEVDYNDHFETPMVAYSDIVPMLKELAKSLGKSPKDLIIYDPYYCQGAMVEMLAELGFSKVVNRNRDFYADIAKGAIPYYDILLTNPPYSGDHKTLLLKYLLTSSLKKNEIASDTNAFYGKPFALLLPAYTATKSYWREFVTEMETKREYKDSNNGGDSENAVLYVLPPDSYEYQHPEGTGKGTPPFFSAWFLGGFRSKVHQDKNEKEEKEVGSEIVKKKGKEKEMNEKKEKKIDEISITGSIRTALMTKQIDKIGLLPRILRVMTSVEDLISAKIVTDKRPSSKKRKKLMSKRGFSTLSSTSSSSSSSSPTVFSFSSLNNSNNSQLKKKTKL